MPMSSKLLNIVFVVLFVFLVGEVVYLFFPSLINPIIRKNMTNQNQVQVNPPLTTLPTKNGKQAIGISVLDYLSRFNVGILKSSTLKNHYEGTIVDLDNTAGDRRVKFEGSNKAVSVFIYSLDEAQRVSVYRSTQKDKDPEKVPIEGLKVGDLVSIDEELDLLENDLNFFLLSVTINVINK